MNEYTYLYCIHKYSFYISLTRNQDTYNTALYHKVRINSREE